MSSTDQKPASEAPKSPSDIQAQELPHQCQLVRANKIAAALMEEIKKGLAEAERKPLLVGFLANDDPAARMYAKWTAKTCEKNGFGYELREVNKEDLEDAILEANEDDKVDGILIYFPVFGTRHDSYLQQLTALHKDVEGLSHKYIFNMYQNIRHLDDNKLQKSILPCTPLAVVKILEYLGVYNQVLPYGNRLFGKTITVVNRSEIVGRPLAALLANDGATVYSVDLDGIQLYTRGEGIRLRQHRAVDTDLTLADVAPKSDVVITGVPSANYKFPTELLKDGAICVNFSSEKNFDEEAVMKRASIYVPAIGMVTIAVLLRNILRLMENRKKGVEV
ncbi:methylenetetrahydrofolate dehydrogenase [NAD+] [Ascobolus immersus RN42]|uniref:Methylenetetrahydrofolate dehydrogenase [NAD(+)] n=1 Tax=Ascobolus immersus RN42 TaxID=1160509 RepID=A0A3N4HQZ8_ASCIM|nr:methylenetetrahydrofolate dehydrogenase [NAD+] [Ascobolus immersus RN42]